MGSMCERARTDSMVGKSVWECSIRSILNVDLAAEVSIFCCACGWLTTGLSVNSPGAVWGIVSGVSGDCLGDVRGWAGNIYKPALPPPGGGGGVGGRVGRDMTG